MRDDGRRMRVTHSFWDGDAVQVEDVREEEERQERLWKEDKHG